MKPKILLLLFAFYMSSFAQAKDWGPFLEQPPITVRFGYPGWYITNTSKETLYAIMMQIDDIPYYKTPKVVIDSIPEGKTVMCDGTRKGLTANFTAKNYSKPLPIVAP